MSTINDSDISGFSLAPYPHHNEKMLPVGLAHIYLGRYPSQTRHLGTVNVPNPMHHADQRTVTNGEGIKLSRTYAWRAGGVTCGAIRNNNLSKTAEE